MDEKPTSFSTINDVEESLKPSATEQQLNSPNNVTISSGAFKVVKFESVTERERSILKLSFGGRSPTKMPTQLIHLADEDESG